ncbi:putative carbohydrate esterase [Nymphaea thermarum]|nr:putative carbohydrate esterase [Nymphaea thermarum]
MGSSGSKSVGSGCEPSAPPPPTEKSIFILSGQSNMSGRGGVEGKKWDGVVPPECRPSPAILRLNAHLRWEEARDPLHADIDTAKVCGIGPGMPFANELLSHLGPHQPKGLVIGLVPCAVGGTAIKEWGRGCHLYEDMVKRAKHSVEEGGSIKALLWYQGESDTTSDQDAQCYGKRMEELIHNVRSDLHLPDLPVIQVAIATGDANRIDKVREAQLGMKLPNVYCVDAKGLPLKSDHLHLTSEAQVRLGKMLAHEYLKHYSV